MENFCFLFIMTDVYCIYIICNKILENLDFCNLKVEAHCESMSVSQCNDKQKSNNRPWVNIYSSYPWGLEAMYLHIFVLNFPKVALLRQVSSIEKNILSYYSTHFALVLYLPATNLPTLIYSKIRKQWIPDFIMELSHMVIYRGVVWFWLLKPSFLRIDDLMITE
jgi:hypothetical protein